MKHSEESKRKMSEAAKGHKRNLGKKYSEEHRRKISEGLRGKKHTEERRLKNSNSHKGHKPNMEVINKIAESNRGKHRSLETRLRISASQKGEKGYWWKGGVTEINFKIRNSMEYRLWREAVFKRDNYTCIFCMDNKGGNLNADHIKRFSDYPELRFAIDNGRTLCEDCHKKTDTWGNKKQKICQN